MFLDHGIEGVETLADFRRKWKAVGGHCFNL